jgi:prolyl-tRNA editing enzyme YbaK/EbsC (Cys-tRNA(Pro) deacylase)
MGIAEVRAEFESRGLRFSIIEPDAGTATVDEAASALGVEPDRIAKTIAVWKGCEPLLILACGSWRLDNRKFKDAFKQKPRMLSAEEVLAVTGHPVGGICPFGLPSRIAVYLDGGLRRFGSVFPAAGSPNSAVEIPIGSLPEATRGEWADLCTPRPDPAG